MKDPLWPTALAGAVVGAIAGWAAFDLPGATIFAMVGFLWAAGEHFR